MFKIYILHKNTTKNVNIIYFYLYFFNKNKKNKTNNGNILTKNKCYNKKLIKKLIKNFNN